MISPLKEKCALVTGGSRGIGAAIVRQLARDGAHVALTYVGRADETEEAAKVAHGVGVRAFAIQADSANPEAVAAAIERTVVELGRIDILVNNAGVISIAPIDAFSLRDFDHTFAVNVRAVFAVTQAAVKPMQQAGRMINIGSCNAQRMPFTGGAVDTISKAALVGLVKGPARDLGPRGITINNIQPGPVDTDSDPETGESPSRSRG